ncbi:MAG: RES domain-containing protein [Candidatus Delongbacteria bacterium]|nr:RES domain-containing protein [Candidatus Delongbacteria bacterium]
MIIYQNMTYLNELSNELSRPVNPNDINLEYLPSQYLCEFIKQVGYDGIIYKSSLSKGSNYVIFNDHKFKNDVIHQFKISDLNVKFKEVK